jgi:hypothetical protein
VKRTSNNRDLFEAPAGEVITVTVEAVKTPFDAPRSTLESGGQWSMTQSPTPANPIDVRTFTMPAGSRELFVIDYTFPPTGVIAAGALYHVTISGGGTIDGPNEVDPPPSGTVEDLPYEFRLPGAAVGAFGPPRGDTVSAKPPKAKKPAKKKHI